jgi:Type II CAAX prenyl endopeptidase Rce1-like
MVTCMQELELGLDFCLTLHSQSQKQSNAPALSENLIYDVFVFQLLSRLVSSRLFSCFHPIRMPTRMYNDSRSLLEELRQKMTSHRHTQYWIGLLGWIILAIYFKPIMGHTNFLHAYGEVLWCVVPMIIPGRCYPTQIAQPVETNHHVFLMWGGGAILEEIIFQFIIPAHLIYFTMDPFVARAVSCIAYGLVHITSHLPLHKHKHPAFVQYLIMLADFILKSCFAMALSNMATSYSLMAAIYLHVFNNWMVVTVIFAWERFFASRWLKSDS